MAREEKPLEYQRRIRDTKGIAQRLDLNYLNRPALLALLRRRLTWALLVVCAAAAIPLVTGVAGGKKAVMSGPVSPAHAQFADRCEKCHTKAFGGVPDQACRACHQAEPHNAKKTPPPCAQCHLEHQGKAALTDVASGNCTACHAGRPISVTAFRAGKHPDFSTAKMTDTRPLKLNHAIHMPAAPRTLRGIKLPMKCSDCHATDRNSPTGDFLPVAFEQNCKSCHARELEFDVDHVLGPNAAPAPHTRNPETIRAYVEAAYRNVHADARAAEAYLFNRKCVYCHVAQAGWPVQVGTLHGRFPTGEPWLARGEFNHRRHRAVACESCHTTARASTKTGDVLIPRIDTCLPCHTDTRAGLDRCSLCHLYHNPGRVGLLACPGTPSAPASLAPQLLSSSAPHLLLLGGTQ
jgi:hypothetical protein